MFFKPKAKNIAKRDLEEAERQLLVYENQELFARHMKEYYAESIKRLTQHVETIDPVRPL